MPEDPMLKRDVNERARESVRDEERFSPGPATPPPPNSSDDQDASAAYAQMPTVAITPVFELAQARTPPSDPGESAPSQAPTTPSTAPVEQRPVRLALTEEELAVILRGIGAAKLPGFHPGWAPPGDLTGSFSTEGRRVLEAASRSLVARGILTPPNNPFSARGLWTMPASIYGLVGSCAFATNSLFLQARIGNSSREAYIHELENVAVARTNPMDQIHLLSYIGGQKDIPRTVGRFFALKDQAYINPFPPMRLIPSDMQMMRSLIANGKIDQAVRALDARKWNKAQATVFCQTLAATHVTGIITIGKAQANKEYTVSWALFVSPQAILTLTEAKNEASDRGPEQVVIQSISAQDILLQIENLLDQKMRA